MSGEVTSTKEEYLETIYRLQRKSGVARTSEIVDALKVTPGTVTNTVERLEREGLVTHEPYKGVKLTGVGLKLAQMTIRRHRLAERLLTDIIGVGWAEAHSYACRLEHGICDDVADRLEEILYSPASCPHGNPIPSKSGKIKMEETKPLSEASTGETLEVVMITEEDSEMLRYLASKGFTPGTNLTVVERAPFEGPLTVRVDGNVHAVACNVASIVWVRRKEPLGKKGGGT